MAEVIKEYAYDKKVADAEKVKNKWWVEKDEDIYAHVVAVARRIAEKQTYRSLENLKHARLYSNRHLKGLQAGMFSLVENAPTANAAMLSLNVIKSCVDTVTSKIGKAKPRPLFLTVGGNWSQQRRAKRLTEYMDGWFDEARVYQHGRMAFRDACIFGTGGVKMYRENGAVKVERTITDEIIVDDIEGMYGTPQQLHQRKYVAREVLLDLYPKAKDRQAILSAISAIKGEAYNRSSADMVEVWESWHLPSGPKANDGKHTICIENATLFSEQWKKPYFPFVFLRWSPRIVGFYGMGLAEELTGIQIEINKILINIRDAQHLVAVPQVWLEIANKANRAQMDNRIGGIKYYTGTPPQFLTPSAMAPDVYQHLENLYKKAFEISGVSMLSAAARKPSGLDAAVAMREYQDIESERFMTVSMDLEDFYMRLAEMAIDFHEDEYEENKDISVAIESKKVAKKIKWSDCKMDRKEFKQRIFPTSILPTTAAGKLQKVQELLQAGFIDKETGLSLLDFPDLERASSLLTAGTDDIMMIIEKMLDGEPQIPEPYENLKLAKRMVQSAYLRAKNDGAPTERLELLQNWMDLADGILNGTLLGQPQPPPAPEQPMAEPMPPPQSDLMPMEGVQPMQ